VNAFAGDRLGQVDAILQLALQSMHDHPEVVTPGILRVGQLELPANLGVPQEGDGENRLVELMPSAALLDQAAALHRVVGARPDEPALLEASRKARARLPELKRGLSRDLKDGFELRVKAPFMAGEEREYMWVRVQRWEGDQLTGTLEDSPRYVKDLVAGAVVHVREAEIFDWLRDLPDGGREGNETTRVLLEGQ
jgi:uncharacterized protein YegJ (DUF2314 family)